MIQRHDESAAAVFPAFFSELHFTSLDTGFSLFFSMKSWAFVHLKFVEVFSALKILLNTHSQYSSLLAKGESCFHLKVYNPSPSHYGAWEMADWGAVPPLLTYSLEQEIYFNRKFFLISPSYIFSLNLTKLVVLVKFVRIFSTSLFPLPCYYPKWGVKKSLAGYSRMFFFFPWLLIFKAYNKSCPFLVRWVLMFCTLHLPSLLENIIHFWQSDKL